MLSVFEYVFLVLYALISGASSYLFVDFLFSQQNTGHVEGQS